MPSCLTRSAPTGPLNRAPKSPTDLFWAYDKSFGQAYGVVADGHTILPANSRRLVLRYQGRDGKVAVPLAPGESYRLVRRVIPGDNLFDIEPLAVDLRRKGQSVMSRLDVKDTSGRPIPDADVVLTSEGKPRSWGRTDADGQPCADRARDNGDELGFGPRTRLEALPLPPDAAGHSPVELHETGAVVAKITDEQGGPIPCKVQFIGRDGTTSPDFGPDSGEHAIKNVYYSHDGQFRRELAPGSYDVIVSYGPEYDAVFSRSR